MMEGCYETVTLWNSCGDKYVRHILPVKCRRAKGGAVVPLSKSYCDPIEWDALSDYGKNTFFTLREGDLIAFGEKSDEVKDEAGCRLNDILEKYKPRAFFIGGVSDRSRARCGAHFFVHGG